MILLIIVFSDIAVKLTSNDLLFIGMYKEHKTGLLLPILIGSYMDDPAGGDLEVPILGSDKDKSGAMRPLGGTMEDPQGSGIVM